MLFDASLAFDATGELPQAPAGTEMRVGQFIQPGMVLPTPPDLSVMGVEATPLIEKVGVSSNPPKYLRRFMGWGVQP